MLAKKETTSARNSEVVFAFEYVIVESNSQGMAFDYVFVESNSPGMAFDCTKPTIKRKWLNKRRLQAAL